jgi:hypothetical protein
MKTYIVTLHLRCPGDWSNKLVNAAEKGEHEVNILLEGPAYGSLSIVNLERFFLDSTGMYCWYAAA